MALHIKNKDVEIKVRYLAAIRGIGITDAIGAAVDESLAAHKSASQAPVEALTRRLQPLFDEMATYDLKYPRTDKAFFDKLWEEEGL